MYPGGNCQQNYEARKSSYNTNWHNYQVIKLLSGLPENIPATARVRAINLATDTLWSVLDDLPDNVTPLLKPQRRLSKALRTHQ